MIRTGGSESELRSLRQASDLYGRTSLAMQKRTIPATTESTNNNRFLHGRTEHLAPVLNPISFVVEIDHVHSSRMDCSAPPLILAALDGGV